MKTKSLLAVLAAAAMLCTAALPAYADDDTPPAAPAAVEEQVSETLPTAGQQTGDGDIEQQSHVTALEAPQNGEGENSPVVQESMASLNLGGNWRMVSKKITTYFALNDGSLEDGTAENYNVKIEFKNDDCYVTLNNAAFTNASNDTNYTALYYEGNLHVTLNGINILPGAIATVAQLDIDGNGTAEITANNDSGWNGFISGTQGVSISGSVKIHGKNLGTKPVTGISCDNGLVIRDNVEISLEGNMENGITVGKANFRMEGGKLTLNGAKAQIDGENIRGGNGIFADSITINAGTVTIENTEGNGISTINDMTINGGTVEIKNTSRAPYGQYGYGGNAITTGQNLNVTGGILIVDKSANNDVFTNSDLNITGGTLKLTNGAVALASHANIKISEANVSIENISGHALSAYIGDIEVVNTTFTLKNGGFDGAVTTSGNITVRGGKFTIDGAKRFGLHAGSGQNAANSDVIIDGAEVKINSVWPMLASPAGNVKINGKAKITGASSEGNALYSINNIQITGNDCEIEVTGANKGAYAKKGILFENADKLTKMGGTDAASAQQIEAAELPNYQYIHIYKGANRPKDDVIIDAKNWTEGDSANAPTITDKNGNMLKAKVYYKLKGAADSTYTETVPTAAGEYEVALVVPADATYAETVYYDAFTIAAKPNQPSTPSNGGDSGNTGSSSTTTTTATATASTPTPAPSTAAKPQSAPAAVTAAIPQTSDAFPYAGLAALMGTAALGMAGVTVLRKKRQ